MITRIRKRLYRALEDSDASGPVSRAIRFALAALILVNITCAVLETMPELAGLADEFRLIELFSVTVFTLEYFARLWVVVERDPRPIRGRLRHAMTPMMIVDLLSVVPSWLSPGVLDTRYARAFRLVRLLKLTRHSRSMQLIFDVVRNKIDELASTAFIAGLLLIVSSSVMYYAEHTAQPEAFPSIPATMWWGMTTLTTVGYGDIVPITPLGRLVGGIVAILGVGLFALPTAILGSGFVEAIQTNKATPPAAKPTSEG